MSQRAFTSERAGVRVQLPAEEREYLASLLSQVDEMLDDGTDPEQELGDALAQLRGLGLEQEEHPPDTQIDPALRRLLPDGCQDDPQAAAEYRRFTEQGLRNRKRRAARAAADALQQPEPVILGDSAAAALLTSMNDLRLVLAERLQVSTDEDAALIHRRVRRGDGDGRWLALAATYEVLTSWHEDLVRALTKRRQQGAEVLRRRR